MGRGPPRWQGIEDDDGRLMVLIAYNNDVQDAWQWADDPRYPHELVNLALRLGVNVAMYAMTHWPRKRGRAALPFYLAELRALPDTPNGVRVIVQGDREQLGLRRSD